ncbi:MAG: hypothetical protein KGP12_07195 [Actinomycetales bacterium]|nr:hypothetical protein [Actinomycetales bacterium]
MWEIGIIVLACGAAACYRLPHPAPVSSWRATAAMALTVAMAWTVIAVLLAGAHHGYLPLALLLAGLLALVAGRSSLDAQSAAWITALAWTLMLLAGSILALRLLEPFVASWVIALAGSAVIASRGPGPAGTSAAIVLPAWLAWAQAVIDLPGERGPIVDCFLAVSSLGFMVLALRGRQGWPVAAWAGTAEVALLLMIGPGAGLAGTLVGTLALGVVVLGLLLAAGRISRLAARRCLAVLALAAGVAALLTAGWSLLLGRGIGPGWVVIIAALGWLVFPSSRYP